MWLRPFLYRTARWKQEKCHYRGHVAFSTALGRPLAPQPWPSADGSADTQQVPESQQWSIHLTGLGSGSQRPWVFSLQATQSQHQGR